MRNPGSHFLNLVARWELSPGKSLSILAPEVINLIEKRGRVVAFADGCGLGEAGVAPRGLFFPLRKGRLRDGSPLSPGQWLFAWEIILSEPLEKEAFLDGELPFLVVEGAFAAELEEALSPLRMRLGEREGGADARPPTDSANDDGGASLSATLARFCALLGFAGAPPTFSCSEVTLLAVAEALDGSGLRAVLCAPGRKLREVALPGLVRWEGECRLVLACARGEVLLAESGAGVRAVSEEEFLTTWDGYVLCAYSYEIDAVRPEGVADDDDDFEPGKQSKKAMRKRVVRTLFQILSRSRAVLLNSFLLAGLGVLVGLATPQMIRSMVDMGTLTRDVAGVAAAFGGVCLLLLFFGGCHFASEALFARFRARFDTEVDGLLHRQMLASALQWRGEQGPGQALAWLREAEQLKEFLYRHVPAYVVDGLQAFSIFMILFFYGASYALIPLAAFAVGFSGFVVWRLTLRRSFLSGFQLATASGNTLAEVVEGMVSVRACHAQSRFGQRWERLIVDSVSRRRSLEIQTTGLAAGSFFLAVLSELATLLLACRDAGAGLLSMGEVFAIGMYATALAAPLTNLAGSYEQWRKARAAFKRVVELFCLRPWEPGSGARALPSVCELRAEGIFVGGEIPINGISFAVAAGEWLEIVDPDGRWNDLLVRLLLMHQAPEEGNFHLGDVPFTLFLPSELRCRMGVVPDNAGFVSGTLLENLCFSDENLSPKEPVRLLDALGLLEEVEALPDGVLHRLGEQGRGLPDELVGRLATARALLRSPRILVLQGVTARCCAQREREFLSRLRAEAPHVALLVLTRRPLGMGGASLRWNQGALERMGV